jgi:O-antigen/teichoic acid export membrane protein
MGSTGDLNSYPGTPSGQPADTRRSAWTSARAVWRRHHDIISNTASLLGTTGLTSAVGFAYWNVAARLFSQQAVGYAAAAVSVIMLLSAVGMSGLGALLMGDLSKHQNRAGLIMAAVLAAGLASFGLAVGFVLVIPHLSNHFADITGSVGHAALLCAGVVLTAMVLVFDEATIGLLRGGLQLTRNMTFVFVKLIAVVAAAMAMHDALGIGILVSWVAAIPVSLLPIAVLLRIRGEPVLPRPDWKTLRRLGRTAAAQNWVSQASQAPALLIPVLVASILPPSVNAGFYAAWSISYVLIVLPSHLSTVLFAVGSADRQAIARKLRFSLRLSLLLGTPAMVILVLGAHLVLSVFGTGYARVAAVPMELLVLAYLPTVPKFFYVAVCRALGKLKLAGASLTAFAVLEVGAAWEGSLRDGLVGLSFALLVVAVAEGIVTTPTVVRAAFGHGRHRQAAAGEASGLARSQVAAKPAAAAYAADGRGVDYDAQRAAMAVLLSLASPARIATVPAAPPASTKIRPEARRDRDLDPPRTTGAL